MNRYLDELRAQGLINDDEFRALLPTGVMSHEELFAVTLHFPSLRNVLPGMSLPKISAMAALRTSAAFRSSAQARLGSPAIFSKGASQPANAPFPIGAPCSQRRTSCKWTSVLPPAN